MALLTLTSPHTYGNNRTRTLMLTVMLATLPGIVAQTLFFGWGNLINIIWAVIVALLSEAIILKLRGRNPVPNLKDYSAALTGILLGLALPSLVPWWVTLVASSFAIIFAKQLYGGLGFNPFNPAMVGYALVLVSFPVAMTVNWAAPENITVHTLTFIETLKHIFGFHIIQVDGFTMATPLDIYKHQVSTHTAQEILKNPIFGSWIADGWEWVNLGFLLGGLLLLYKKIFTWHIPFSYLFSLSFLSLMFGANADLHTPISLNLLAGGTMLGAFFIATDPVTSATSNKGKLIFGAGIGALIYTIRTWGNYPDAVAFAVLLMNFAAPFIDIYTQPRTYGHIKPEYRKHKAEDE